MAKTRIVLKVFVASPSDVSSEREMLEDVIKEINVTLSDLTNVHLELVKWETHSRPGFGEDAQDVINQQINDDYDIFLGLMWGRFGSPTKRAESGTEEEFERAYQRLCKSPGSFEILFYFKDAGIPPSESDPEQLAKIAAFQHKLSFEYGGLYHIFRTDDEFQSNVRIHLSKIVQEWVNNPNRMGIEEFSKLKKHKDEIFNPLANFSSISDEGVDDGILEITENLEKEVNITLKLLEEIGNAVELVGEKITKRTIETDSLLAKNTGSNTKGMKNVINFAASDLEQFVAQLAMLLPDFHKHQSNVMDNIGKLSIIFSIDSTQDEEDRIQVVNGIKEYRENVLGALDGMSSFREGVARIPRLTSNLNRARKRTVAIVDDLMASLQSAINQADEIENFLKPH